jgi:hypothetical protein
VYLTQNTIAVDCKGKSSNLCIYPTDAWAIKPKDWEYSSFHRYVRDGIYDVMWGADVVIKEEG